MPIKNKLFIFTGVKTNICYFMCRTAVLYAAKDNKIASCNSTPKMKIYRNMHNLIFLLSTYSI